MIEDKHRCCGKEMEVVGVATHWCGNCGAIYSKSYCKGKVSPNLNICATCIKWGSEGEHRGVTMRCYNGQHRWTSPGCWCSEYVPSNPPTIIEEEI